MKERIPQISKNGIGKECEWKGERLAFCVDGTERLLSLCKRLLDAGCRAESSLYWDLERNTYYLLIGEETLYQSELPKHPELREFSCSVLHLIRFSFLIEHCSLICDKNAVEIIGKLS